MINAILSLLRRPFVRDIGILQAGQLVAMFCSFLVSVFYARYLGLDGYGSYATVLAFAGLLAFFTNLGQQVTTLTFFAEAHGNKDQEALRDILRYYMIVGILSASLLLFCAFLSPFLARRIYGPTTTIGSLAVLVFAASMLDIPTQLFSIVLQVTRKIRWLVIFENAQIAFQLALSIIFLLWGKGIAGILWASLLSSLLFCAIALACFPPLFAAERLPGIRDIVHPRGMGSFWKYLKNSFWIAVDKNVGGLYPKTFLFILSTRTSPAVVGLVRLALRLGDLPISFALSNVARLSSSVIPQLASQGFPVLWKNLKRLVGYTYLYHFAMSLGAAICVPLFLPYVYGSSYLPAIYPFFVLLALNMLQPLHTFATPILRLHTKTYYSTIQNLLSTGIAIVVFYIFAGSLGATRALYVCLVIYHLGACGVILPTLFLLRKERGRTETPAS